MWRNVAMTARNIYKALGNNETPRVLTDLIFPLGSLWAWSLRAVYRSQVL